MTPTTLRKLQDLTGKQTSSELMDYLQLERTGLISDLCVTTFDVPESDALRAVEALTEQTELF